MTHTTNHTTTPAAYTMRGVFNALVKENGATGGKSIFEWYCATYGVTITDDAPDSVRREVFGI